MTRYVGLWHGGVNYSAPWADDAELFDSIAEAADAMRDRRDLGYSYPQRSRFLFREETSSFTPCAHENGSGYVDLFRIDRARMTRDQIRTYLETDAYPDVRLVFGPRGGIRRDV